MNEEDYFLKSVSQRESFPLGMQGVGDQMTNLLGHIIPMKKFYIYKYIC